MNSTDGTVAERDPRVTISGSDHWSPDDRHTAAAEYVVPRSIPSW
jgi:hypothetical protein